MFHDSISIYGSTNTSDEPILIFQFHDDTIQLTRLTIWLFVCLVCLFRVTELGNHRKCLVTTNGTQWQCVVTTNGAQQQYLLGQELRSQPLQGDVDNRVKGQPQSQLSWTTYVKSTTRLAGAALAKRLWWCDDDRSWSPVSNTRQLVRFIAKPTTKTDYQNNISV